MTVTDDGKRIRGRKLTEEERAAAKHVSFRLQNEITDKVRFLAKKNHRTQGAQMQQCIVDGLELGRLIERARQCIIQTDPALLANAKGSGAALRVPKDMQPSDAECMRFVTQAVQDAIRQRFRDFEESQEVEGSM